MNCIRLLPEQVANQIAAGEVVERPASVVKELVENALDARAKRVTVEIQAGGRSLIRITDDGTGMSRDDALLCLERHATSKIQKAEDLASIATMGFRGEAIPSIASVSRMVITTRERSSENEEGTQIVIQGGRIQEVKAAGAAPGTSIEVRQIFFNLPARRKFLRSEETERAHIQHYLTLAALAFPEVAFTFLNEGRPVWQLPAVVAGSDADDPIHAVQQRMRGLLGGDVSLLRVDFSETVDPGPILAEGETEAASVVRVWGLIGAPGVSRANREDQHVFVNRRPVENRGLNYALLEGYHTALMKGRYPVCCLFLDIDPAAVDVNIHPAKREVKFHQESAVRRITAQAVRQALLDFHAASARSQDALSTPALRLERTAIPSRPDTVIAQAPGPDRAPPATPELPRLFPSASPRPNLPLPQSVPSPADDGGSKARLTAPPAEVAAVFTPDRLRKSADPVPLLNIPLRIIGVLGRLYVVLESDRGLVLLDQHAAHERILFEQMLRRLEQNDAPSQKLLLPETIELSARDAEFLRQQLSALTRLGVGLSEFGERTFLLDALPPFVKAPNARGFVLELVDQLKAAGEGVNSWRLGEHTVAKTVCRHAVKANDVLSGPELETLLNDLRHCAMPYTCPHGRPTLIEMGFSELEKKFGRTQ